MQDAKQNVPFHWENGAWKILREMLTSPGFLIQHQIDPFNDFLDKGLANVIEQFNPIILNYDFITEQKFFKFKQDSKYHQNDNWIEYRELSDIHKLFKDKYSIINNQITTIDLSEQLGTPNDKDQLLQTEFKEFVEEHLEFKTIDVNKHRYDLEINIYFNSITPPVIYENNGSQKVMYPNEARARNFTYASNTFIDFHFKTRERFGEAFCNTKEHPVIIIPKVTCGKLPIMLGSKACILASKTYNKKIDYEEC